MADSVSMSSCHPPHVTQARGADVFVSAPTAPILGANKRTLREKGMLEDVLQILVEFTVGLVVVQFMAIPKDHHQPRRRRHTSHDAWNKPSTFPRKGSLALTTYIGLFSHHELAPECGPTFGELRVLAGEALEHQTCGFSSFCLSQCSQNFSNSWPIHWLNSEPWKLPKRTRTTSHSV
jgi:hypothetical protein